MITKKITLIRALCVCELSEIMALHYEIGLITMVIMYMQSLDLFDFQIFLLMLHFKFLIESVANLMAKTG